MWEQNETSTLCFVACVAFRVPLDEVVDQVFDSLLHLSFLQWDRVALIRHFDNKLPQFVQLTFDLEETLGCQSKPERVRETCHAYLQCGLNISCHTDLFLQEFLLPFFGNR